MPFLVLNLLKLTDAGTKQRSLPLRAGDVLDVSVVVHQLAKPPSLFPRKITDHNKLNL